MSDIIIASGPVIIENKKVLLVKHGEDSFWKFCGGRVEDGERNLKEVARREASEELGIKINVLNEPPYFFYTEKGEEKRSVVLVHFLATYHGEVNPGVDIRDFRWLSKEDLSTEDLAPNILPTLEHFGF
ncbi:MAG: NUDIX domain-containing protein [Patescibacteria group bacterium]